MCMPGMGGSRQGMTTQTAFAADYKGGMPGGSHAYAVGTPVDGVQKYAYTYGKNSTGSDHGAGVQQGYFYKKVAPVAPKKVLDVGTALVIPKKKVDTGKLPTNRPGYGKQPTPGRLFPDRGAGDMTGGGPTVATYGERWYKRNRKTGTGTGGDAIDTVARFGSDTNYPGAGSLLGSA